MSRSALVLTALALLAAPLAAQVPGLPHRNAGVVRGLQVGMEAGFPDSPVIGTPAVGASAALGIGLLGVTVVGSSWKNEISDDREVGAGLYGSFRLLGGPLVPLAVALQAGVSRWSETALWDDIILDESVTAIPVGLGFALTIPSPIVSFKPWLAPRLQWTDREAASWTVNTALSGGIDLGFINGTALRGAYDRVFLEGADRSVWSLGLAHSVRVGW